MRQEDALQILGLDDNPSPDEIRRAFKCAAKQFHPDLQSDEGNRKRTEEWMKRLVQARDCLLNGSWETRSTDASRDNEDEDQDEDWDEKSSGYDEPSYGTWERRRRYKDGPSGWGVRTVPLLESIWKWHYFLSVQIAGLVALVMMFGSGAFPPISAIALVGPIALEVSLEQRRDMTVLEGNQILKTIGRATLASSGLALFFVIAYWAILVGLIALAVVVVLVLVLGLLIAAS